jgi:hypothetical protein
MDLPRVTHILETVGLGPDFGGIPPAVLEKARARGSAVHAAIEAHAYGYLEPAMLTPTVAPYFSAYQKFLAESAHEATCSEIEVVHPAWQYVGHPDRIGWLMQRRALLDWKTAETVDVRCATLQLAAYRMAWNAMHPAEPIDLTAVVQFKRDGTYRFHDVNARAVEQVFLAAVTVYRAREDKERAA